MKRLSVIIVTYDSADTIGTCLESFGKWLDADGEVEIVVVDNSSADGTVSIVNNKYPSINIIRNSANLGFASAVNIGVAASKSHYLLLLNPDTELEYNFFDELLPFLEQLQKPAIVGCRLLNMNGSVQNSTWKVPNLRTLICETFLPYSISLPLVTEHPNGTCQVPTVTGAAMAFDRAVFSELGGFDEKFFMYLEDLDFCIRAKKAGYLNYYFEPAAAKHVGGKSSSKSLDDFFANYYSSKLHYFRKHYSRSISACAFALLYIGCVIRIIVYGLAGMRIINRHFLKLSKSHIFALKKIFH
jgi:GT2 family glycosyltransferase